MDEPGPFGVEAACGAPGDASARLQCYAWVRALCVGREVLDVAAAGAPALGEALLGPVARAVTRVEPGAPMAASGADVVLAFDAVSAAADSAKLLRALHRALRPGGLLVLGLPSADSAMLGQVHGLFAHSALLTQRAVEGWLLAPAGGAGGAEILPGADVGGTPAALLVVASDSPLPALPAAFLASDPGAARSLAEPRAAEAGPLTREALIADLRDVIAEKERTLTALRSDVAERVRRIVVLQGETRALREAVALLGNTPMRRLVRRMPGLVLLLRRGRDVIWWTLTGQLPLRWRAWRAARRSGGLPMPVPGGPDMRALLALPPEPPTPAAEEIQLPPMARRPRLSVIIPTYGQVDHTLRCLASFAAAPPAVPCELIVVDDASPDPRAVELAAVQGIRLLRNAENLGFLRSCNAAAKLARGELLFFLNNDTEVMPGAVEALANLLAMRPDAGLVGARLLYPDGMQQEAGGIVWADGSAWNYGRRDDPRKPEYSYVREADYISGAAIMLPRALWERLGGFDEHYLPAYCEDTDLAFRIRALGLKVLYQPEAVVIHHEGVSHGTDLTRGIKAHQVENQKKFLARWGDTLAAEHYPNGAHVMRARDRARHRRVTLLLEHSVPEPDRDAGSRTILAFIEALLATGRVVKFWPANGHPTPGYTEALRWMGVEVLPRPSRLEDWLMANGADLDEVLISRPAVAEWCLPALARFAPQAPIVFYGHDLHHRRLRKEAEVTGEARLRAEADKAEALERGVWRRVDVSLYLSDEEVAAVREAEGAAAARRIPIAVLPPSRARTCAPAGPPRLMFVAGFAHKPNVDAAVWFVREILPHVRAACPEASLALVGSKPSEEVLALAGPGVTVTGFVPDEELARLYGEARVVVAPLRFGAGVKLKVIEALNAGVPIVTTSVGAQGIEGVEEVLDVADSPELFAAHVSRLIRDDALWLARSAAQARFVQGRFSAEAMQRELDAAFAEAARRRAARRLQVAAAS